MVRIFDAYGNLRFAAPVCEGSKRTFRLMGDDCVTLPFKSAGPIPFRLGDWADIRIGETTFGRFEVTKPVLPAYKPSLGVWEYELRLDAQHMKWANKIHRYRPLAGGSECEWSLTATAEVHLEQVLASVAALAKQSEAYLHNGNAPWSANVHPDVPAEAKTIAYSQSSILDALTSIAEAFETEWWVDNGCIHLGKCELPTDCIDLEIGRQIADMPQSSSPEPVSRIIPFGSDRNIPPRYRKILLFDALHVRDGGTRVSDTSRPLGADCFPDANVEVAEGAEAASFRFSGASSPTLVFAAYGRQDIIMRRCCVPAPPDGDYLLKLSEMALTVGLSPMEGTVVVEAVVKDNEGASLVSGSWTFAPEATRGPLPLEDLGVSVNGASQLTLSLTVSLEHGPDWYGHPRTVRAEANLYSMAPARLVGTSAARRMTNLTIERIGPQGEVTDVLHDCSYIPLGEGESDGNTFILPAGATMAQGDRFRVCGLLESKVKSSYFRNKYALRLDGPDEILRGIVSQRLMLPESHGSDYVDRFEGQSVQEGVERVVVFEDVYPRSECRVTDVETVVRNEKFSNDDGTTTEAEYTAFLLTEDFFTAERPWKNEYRLANGKPVQIAFREPRRYRETDSIPAGKRVGDLVNPDSGKLNGWTFDCEPKKQPDGSWRWEILRDSKSLVPNDVLRPEREDVFVLTNIDIAAVDEVFVQRAEEELFDKVAQYYREKCRDTDSYECTLMPDTARELGILQPGTQVNLLNDALFPPDMDGEGRKWGRRSRVTGFEFPLDIPWDNPRYEIGDKPVYSRLGQLEKAVESLTVGGREMAGMPGASRGSSTEMPIVGIHDTTSPLTDTNTLSSLRSFFHFLRRDRDERTDNAFTAAGKLTAESGLQVGPSYAPGPTGFGGRVDQSGNAELESLSLRRFLEVPELRYNRVTLTKSVQWATPGGGIIQACNPGTATAGEAWLKLEEGEAPSVCPGDICMGIFHSGEPSRNATADSDDGRGNFTFGGFATVWFRVTSVDGARFTYTLRPGCAAHPAEAMHFAAYGSFTDPSRRSSRYETSSYIRFLRDVDDWEFTDAMIAAQFGELGNLNIQGCELSGQGLYIDNVYYRNRLKQVDIRFAEMLLKAVNASGEETTVPQRMRPGSSVTLKAGVSLSGRMLTSEAGGWKVERDSGDPQADAMWNAAHPLTPDSEGWVTLALAYADMGAQSTAAFRFSAIATRASSGGDVVQSLARTVVFEREGAEVVDRGPWEEGNEYHAGDRVSASGLLEVSDAWHNGQRWRCQESHTSDEMNAPGVGNPLWEWVGGDPELHLGFAETEQLADISNIRIPLTLQARWHGEDVTAMLAPSDVAWSRESETIAGEPRTALDKDWDTAFAAACASGERDPRAVTLTEADCQTEQSGYTEGVGKLAFTVEATLREPQTRRTMARSRAKTDIMQ